MTAAALASIGHEVAGLDYAVDTVARLNAGTPPLFEPGLKELVAQGLAAGRLRFFDDAAAAVRGCEVLWVAYDTPVDDDDVADVEFVVAQIERTLPHLSDDTTVMVSSQMPVGTIRRLESMARTSWPGRNIRFACSPENLRLGRALEVFLKPDRIVVGVRSQADRERIGPLLRPITDRIEWMSVESAEMTKHAVNAFLATSVTFTNEIAAICEKVGADARDVERGLKTESRIGPKAYLTPGAAFSGGTLARDVEFLKAVSASGRLQSPLLSAIRASNDQHKQWARRKLEESLGDLKGRTVAVWGLTYKAGTSTLRRSLAVELCDALLGQGVRLQVHDPAAEALPSEWAGRVRRTADPVEALANAQALVVATEWPEYRQIPLDSISKLAPGLVVVDANRFLASWSAIASIRYLAVGSVVPGPPETRP
ncbi:MAG TPA: nucleotide sugar dehydrogenase [Burkholderiaceae bacterium]|nr:nucleotide sugar dehydrogenase [Burkholderiaceae bacterium]